MNDRSAGTGSLNRAAYGGSDSGTEAVMGALNKLKNKLQMGRGRVKQDVGRATGDPYLEAEG